MYWARLASLLFSFFHLFCSIFEFLCRKLGWEPKKGESHLDAMLRGEVWTALAVFGYDPTLKEASRRFHAFLDDRNTPLLHPDIRKVGKKKHWSITSIYPSTIPIKFSNGLWLQAAYVAVMRRVSSSNRFGFESLLRVYRETDLNQEKTRVLSNNISLFEMLQNYLNLSSMLDTCLFLCL